MPEDKKTKKHDDSVKEAMAHSEHSMSLPKRDKSKKVWIIVAVIAILALIGVSIYGFIKLRNDNNKIKSQQAQIDELTNKKKTLEDAASATATAATNAAASAISGNYLEVKELGFKLPLSSDIKDLQYFVNDKTAYFSTASLQSSAWGSANYQASSFCSLGLRPLGVITKFANASDAGPTEQKVLSGFVLGYAAPQAPCSDGQATVNLQKQQTTSLQKAFNNAEKI